MYAYLEKIPLSADKAFYIKELQQENFDAPRHFHPELELMMVFQSAGKRFVGDNVSDYSSGDLVLLGPNIPHYWYRETSVMDDGPVHALVIQFPQSFPGADLLNRLEMQEIKKLLHFSSQGIRFRPEVLAELREPALSITKATGFTRIIRFLEILDHLSRQHDFELLSSPGFNAVPDQEDCSKMNRLYEYILENYTREISFREAARLADMNPSAFCHYFKKRTRKNFSQFVNEIRTGRAAKLLIESDLNVSEICFACGFRNLSNFNRRFREINKISPMEYRKSFRQQKIAPAEAFALV
jgi:AraC-like DNA-binding protein